ncbi:MAG: hypothetical protein KC418_06305 [Anaerolineales bacterium]|nr:hypothetical protein [Anaerolineales bacterium]MCB8953344.1 hypothetical protein [Ardenticatenales bacterium]
MAQYPPLRHKLPGRLYRRDQETVLWLDHTVADIVFVRYALVTIGREEEIFPAFLLDDWGNEQRRLSLYQWVREEGDRFPRAEIFGANLGGEDEQCFLREMERHMSLPCYAYLDADAPLSTGARLTDIMLPAPDVTTPRRIDCPTAIAPPLCYARVQWWQGPAVGPSSEDGYDPWPARLREKGDAPGY